MPNKYRLTFCCLLLLAASGFTECYKPVGRGDALPKHIKQFNYRPLVLDDPGRARVFEITVIAGLTLRDQTKNKVLFNNQNYTFRDEYEIAGDPQNFFNEEGPAVERIARDFAKSVLTTMLEGF